jgi:hypothetical protein
MHEVSFAALLGSAFALNASVFEALRGVWRARAGRRAGLCGSRTKSVAAPGWKAAARTRHSLSADYRAAAEWARGAGDLGFNVHEEAVAVGSKTTLNFIAERSRLGAAIAAP